jgi:hypothetical protein
MEGHGGGKAQRVVDPPKKKKINCEILIRKSHDGGSLPNPNSHLMVSNARHEAKRKYLADSRPPINEVLGSARWQQKTATQGLFT